VEKCSRQSKRQEPGKVAGKGCDRRTGKKLMSKDEREQLEEITGPFKNLYLPL
jgi:hypothetical protein